MKIKPVVAAITLSVAGLSSIDVAANPAGKTPDEVGRSAVSGMVIGAAAGGPVGAFVGTVIGGEVFGRLFEYRRINNDLNTEVSDLAAALESERSEHARSLEAVNRDLDKLLAIQGTTAKSQTLSVQFRTASSDIEAQYEAELNNIARVLRRNRDASITLTGFADRRGDDTYNQALSEQRVASLKQYLLAKGVSRDQVLGVAHGESRPLHLDESLEGNFFDRRVVVELNLDIDPQLATR